jgi:hypothetical protein
MVGYSLCASTLKYPTLYVVAIPDVLNYIGIPLVQTSKYEVPVPDVLNYIVVIPLV